MNSVGELEKRIEQIEKRNKTVEINKKWEVSFTRKISIMLLTYLTLGIYMQIIDVQDPWINALVPVLGFYFSTLTLPIIRKLWEKYKQ